VIAFRFIPTSVVSRPVAAVWVPLVQTPFETLPRRLRLTLGWLSLLAIVFGSAFGFKLGKVGSLSVSLSVRRSQSRCGKRILRMAIEQSLFSASSYSSLVSGYRL
jgi:hypothetical protein